MPDLPIDLTAIMAKLRAVLLHSCGQQLGRVLVSVTYEISREGVSWTLPANEGSWPPEMVRLAGASLPVVDAATLSDASLSRVGASDLGDEDGAILQLLLREFPLMAKKVASRLGVPNNGTLRGRLAVLRRVGLVTNSGRGYSLTDAGRAAVGVPPV